MRTPKTFLAVLISLPTLAMSIGCEDRSEDAPSAVSSPAASSIASTDASSAEAASNAVSVPILTFDDRTIRFGEVADYETREGKATFRNTGTAPLRITNVAPTCGCTSVGFDTSRIYQPGEAGEIVFKFTPKGSGNQAKIVRIASNDPAQPVQNVTIRASVLASLDAEPRVLTTNRIPLRTKSSLSTLVTALRPGVTVDSAKVTGQIQPFVDMIVEPLGPDDEGRSTWRVVAELSDTIPWGWQAGNIAISGTLLDDSGARNPVKLNMAINGNVSGIIEPSAGMLRLGVLRPGNQIAKSITIGRRDGRPLEVVGDPKIDGGAFGILRCLVTPVDAAKTTWRVELRGATPMRTGALVGNIILQTDVPGEELIAIRYAGVVQNQRGTSP